MCKYCEKIKIGTKSFMPTWDGDRMTMKINVDKAEIEMNYDAYSCDSSFEATLSINYCPFCGRKLK